MMAGPKAIDEGEFYAQLAKLVQIESVSPLANSAIEQIDEFLLPWNFEKLGSFWVRTKAEADIWVYAHVDTKPVGDRAAWHTPPHTLERIGNKLFGRGVSDSKFQLLNALHVFDQAPVNFIIDGAEECEGKEAGAYLADRNVHKLIIVDGSSNDPQQIYGGLSGQLDGTINIDTGVNPMHPGRAIRHELFDKLHAIMEQTSGLHFNLTRVHGGDPVRSLTLESVDVGFDLRFNPGQESFVDEFCKRLQIKVRQLFPPVSGAASTEMYPIASFSNPLGMQISGFESVWVLPGGRPENNAHRPNENIDIAQIALHRDLLETFIFRHINAH
jgi:acetylornithine deacetylase/succinyl-diaminopimelate desuccinylase-like protein